ncbi:hypothetical protein KP509_33G006500 [Ceratopteris richardii]|uniref:RING-type domain-containing protein n=1 Tax=Ceratopteris richardii TaxID=49495 RepID=A0A8T2QNB8_CERRI|nr:hypothetical protein KP509_33G006500 [Ceratopteris richardii]
MAHALTLLGAAPYFTEKYICNLCRESGCGPVYHCSHCDFDLHVSCAAMEPVAYHFTHLDHLLLLAPPDPRKRMCDSCGGDIRGWAFRCDECDFDLHSICAKAPRFMRHQDHPHPLELRRQDASRNLECSGCRNRIKNHAYECVVCDFRLHQLCARMSGFLLHPGHADHRLRRRKTVSPTLSSNRRLPTCHRCRQGVQGWELCCSVCDIHFHPLCAGIEEHHLPHESSISEGTYGSRAEASAATSTTTSQPIGAHLTRNVGSPASANTVVEVPDTNDLESLRKIVRFLEKTAISRAQHADQSTPQTNPDATSKDDCCPTCFEGFNSTNPRKTTNCGHSFHLPCIIEWMERSDSCPVCRRRIELEI